MCDWSLAKSAAHVHDAKPEGDVHSILSNPYDLTCFIPSQTSKANIGLTLHTDFVDSVVSACVSTVGIYAVCNALSPEEPRHYNQPTNENYRSTEPWFDFVALWV